MPIELSKGRQSGRGKKLRANTEMLSPNPPIDGARTAEGGKGVTSAMMGA